MWALWVLNAKLCADLPLLSFVRVHRYAFENFANNKFLGTRYKNADGTWGPYKFITYSEAARQSAALAAAFRDLGIEPVRLPP